MIRDRSEAADKGDDGAAPRNVSSPRLDLFPITPPANSLASLHLFTPLLPHFFFSSLPIKQYATVVEVS